MRKSYLTRLLQGKAVSSREKRRAPGIYGGYLKAACMVPLLVLASIAGYAQSANIAGGGVNTTACQGTANVIVYSFSLAEVGGTPSISGFSFTTTAGSAATVAQYAVYMAPSIGNSLTTLPLNAACLGMANNSGPGLQSITNYAGFGLFDQLVSGNTYYFYIIANVLNTAAVGSTISVSPPTVSNFTYYSGSNSAGTNTATSSTITVGSCPCSSTFSYNGNNSTFGGTVQTWVVPTGCTQIVAKVAGASGGDGHYNLYRSNAGRGGIATSTVTVTPGSTLYIYPGNIGGVCLYNGGATSGPGGSNSNGGAQGGNGSYYEGGGGGGESDIRTISGNLSSRFVMGAGGGGGGYGSGSSSNNNGGDGANGGGSGGGLGLYVGSWNSSQCGFPGTLSCCATGGSLATNGALGVGGSCNSGYYGGGGGGGYYGAGGGYFGGACGGSSYATSVTGATVGSTVYADGGNIGSGYVTITPIAPTASTVTGGGLLCGGGTVPVGLSGSVSGVNYQLYNGATAVGSAVVGTGSALTVGNVSATGTYSVVAYYGTNTACTYPQTGTVSVSAGTAPNIFTVSGGGNYCSGGVSVALSGSETGVNYQLKNGATNVGAAVAGTGSALTYSSVAGGAGTYTVLATNTTTGCTANMSGSAVITVGAVPSLTSATNSGPICSTNTLTLTANGAANVTGYAWSGPVAITGASSASATVPAATTAATGIYTVVVNNGAGPGCTATYTTSAVVNALPSAFTLTGGGPYCVGGAGSVTGLSGSQTGVNYQLKNGATNIGSAVAGTGSAISFGTISAAGTYSVQATNPTSGCTVGMTGSTTISVNPAPSLTSATSSGTICAGNTLTLSANGSSNVTGYTWTGPVTVTNSTSAVATVPSAPTSATGVYTVAVNNGTGAGCSVNYTTSATVQASSTVYTVTGGGAYCTGGTGVPVGLSGSTAGIQYQLYLGSSTVGGIVTGTGSPLNFGLQTALGTYSVSATNTSTGCIAGMSGTPVVSISPIPNVYSVGGGGGYCSGGTGATVTLSNSDAGVTYQLYRGATAVGSLVAGTGSSVSFAPQTVAGTYSVVANPGSTCATNMTGSTNIFVNGLPSAFNVTGPNAYCAGTGGVHIGLDFSNPGTNYQLYLGSTPIGAAVAGSSSAIDFGLQTTAGTYSVLATIPATTCQNAMTGTLTVSINPLPASFTVTGGGNYCSGGTGMSVGLSGSASGINYQLYNGASLIGSPVAGTGSALDFGLQTAAGGYTVMATNPLTSCSAAMASSASITVNSLPVQFVVSGGGTYCAGSAGVHILQSGSTSGVNYQLFNGATPVGSPTPGNGSALDFGLVTGAGTYSVQATNAATTCQRAMSGTASVTINAAPAPFAVSGSGSYCSGGSGLPVGLPGSTSGISYQLYNGAVTTGAAVSGTGSAITFGNQTAAGTYTVLATNGSTGCTAAMTGSAIISINSLPNSFTMTGGGAYCSGGTGQAVGIIGSNSGITYQLMRSGLPVGTGVAGTGSAVSFGLQTVAGDYTVIATNNTTTCSATMPGVATITVTPLPTAYTVTGGGQYCSGGTGAAIGLSSSTSGVTYSLSLGLSLMSTVAGTGTSISFGLQTSSGTYTVLATASGCSNPMTGSATITVNSLPTVQTVTGGGSYCSGGTGVTIGLSPSTSGINYQLYNGASTMGTAVAGTGAAISFPLQTTAGTYTVSAVNPATGCTANMSGSAAVTILPIPTAFTVTGGGQFCTGGTGVPVGVNSSSSGVSYQLYNGSTPGATLSGTGASLSFGNMTAAGTYTVRATSTSNLCTNGMSGAATVTVNSLPTVYTVTGGGNYCAGGAGMHVYLGNSTLGVNYQLYNGSLPVGSPVAGPGAAIDFGALTSSGLYSVLATNGSTGCSANMSGTATIGVDPVPTVYAVTGGGQYCSGGTGVHIGLAGSNTGISYQLMNGAAASGSPMSGTGTALDFGLITTGGSYTILASNSTTGCSSNMSGGASVVVNSLPSVFTVTGGGQYCAGGSGVNVGLSGSTAGIAYQLYNGATTSGSPLAGTGLPLDFGLKTASGSYVVMAINPSTTCTNTMFGGATITVNTNPTVFAVTGGGQYCSGGAGVAVGVSGSSAGVNYQLYNGGAVVGGPVAGTGGSISFGLQTTAGTYTVSASNGSTSCASNMSGAANVSINALPTVYIVTGGGNYCSGGTGVTVALNGSNIGISYQLYNGATPAGSPAAGTGAPVSFGAQTAAGGYYVIASNVSTGCTNNMSGTATVGVNPAPTAYTVTGGGNYCAGGAGMTVGLSSSNTGIFYQLYNGTTAVGGPMSGTGASLSFGAQTAAGSYNVVATNGSTSCTSNMTGAVAINVNALPTAYTVTGGGNFCSGGAGLTVGLSGSNTGIVYQLYNGSTPVAGGVAGTGGTISFGAQSSAGTYTVLATNTGTSCANGMTGSAVIGVGALPTAYTVTGGGNMCAGAAGVVVGLGGSNTGVSYQLYNGSVATGAPLAGTGGTISFGAQTTAGTYSVMATSLSSGCSNGMTGTTPIVVNPQPTAFNLTGGGVYCSGGSGVTVGLSGSNTGISYQLYNGGSPVGAPLSGSGSPLSFGSVTTAGSYNVVASDISTSCVRNMNGTATINANPAPVVYTMTGGGGYCTGGSGVPVGLSSSNSGINYQLFNGASALVTVPGTGGAISFGLQTNPGTYSVVATSASTSCTSNMAGTATVSVNSAPNPYNVLSLASSYCEGGTGVNVLLSGSDIGTSYQLYNGSITAGAPVAGTGAMLDFGPQTGGGVYMVVATSGGSCNGNMTGTAAISVNPQPTAYATGGTGAYCAGTSGAVITLSGSNTGVTYQLFRGTTLVGAAVAGTGSPISFAPQTTVGSYVVVATTTASGCNRVMSGTVPVSVNPAPVAQTVTGGGQYCSGGTGVSVGLANSVSGVSYQLYTGGTLMSTVSGSGSSVSFGPQTTAGTYTVMAVNSTTSCTNAMTGSALITVNALPTAYAVTGGGNFCVGSVAGVPVMLGNSAIGVTYQLYNGSTAVGGFIAGTGVSLDFGMQSASGVYSIRATDATTLCSSVMSGSATVNANAAPAVHTVTGGGSYCTGGTGVHVGLDGSNPGISYRLYNSASTAVGSSMLGTGAALDFGPITGAGTYTVLATNTATACTNNMNGNALVSITTSVAPSVTINTGVGDTVCHGILTTFTATPVNGGSAPAYQWQVNGINVGLGLGTYSYLPANGDVISVQLMSSSSCATPSIAVATKAMSVLVSQLPVATMNTTPNDTTCMGTPVTLSVTPSFGGSAPVYTWMKGTAVVATGTTSYTYSPTDGDVVYVKMASNYRCRLADNVESIHTTMVVDSLQTPVVALSTGAQITIVSGQAVTITASVSKGGHNPQFQWYINGAPVPGATTNVFTSVNLHNNDSVTCNVTNFSACAPTTGYRSTLVKISTEVGSVSLSSSDIKLLPNPNKGEFIIRGTLGTADDQELTAEVTNMLGQVVYREKIAVHNGNLNERIVLNNTLANGMYMMSLRSANENKVFHFVLEQ